MDRHAQVSGWFQSSVDVVCAEVMELDPGTCACIVIFLHFRFSFESRGSSQKQQHM